jgi:hypothetical protein
MRGRRENPLRTLEKGATTSVRTSGTQVPDGYEGADEIQTDASSTAVRNQTARAQVSKVPKRKHVHIDRINTVLTLHKMKRILSSTRVRKQANQGGTGPASLFLHY